MFEKKKVIIIGGGISGLSAGIYAQKNGLEAVIIEKNASIGGFCTGWTRQDFYLDGCMHWLTGTKEGTVLNRSWKEVGAFSSQEDLYYLNIWGTFEYQGIRVPFYRDLELAEKTWLEISPIDKKIIHRFFKIVKDIASIELPLETPTSMIPFKDILKFGIQVINIWPSYLLPMKMSVSHFAKKFKSPALRWALNHAQPGDGNLFSMAFSYATIADGNGGVIIGGSKVMAERMKETFISCGGKLMVNSPVSHVIIENDIAIGVYLKDGTTISGDYVIAACDPHYAYEKLLNNKYQNYHFNKRYFTPKRNPSPSCCLLHFAIEDLEDLPIPYSFEIEPIHVGASNISHLTLRNYSYDKQTFVKDNKTVVQVLIDQYGNDFDLWNNAHLSKPFYNKLKQIVAEHVKERIIAKFPQYENKITLLDIATPYTLYRYNNASRGSYMGFLFNKRSNMYVHNGKVSGLKNFYLSGQWMQCPGGLPLALSCGKFTIQRICKKENLKFIFTRKAIID